MPIRQMPSVEPMDRAEVGPRAAWRYLCLAVQALLVPAAPGFAHFREHVPVISGSMRLYLLFNFVLYGVVGLAFLVPSQAFHIGHSGQAILDNSLPHVLWGFTALAVSVLQLAAMASDRWRVWQLCAVATAAWATALGMVTLILAHAAGTYTAAVLWFWVTGVHWLMIHNQLVSHEDHHTSFEDLPEQDRTIVQAMEQFRTPSGRRRSTTHSRSHARETSYIALPVGISAALPLIGFVLLLTLLPLR